MAGAQQGNQSDHSASIIWTVAAIFVALGAIWYVFKDQIILFYLQIKLYELNFLSLFNAEYFAHQKSVILSAMSHPQNLDFPTLVAIGQGVGDILRIPFVVILLALALLVYLSNTTRMFKHIYNMKQLAKLEQHNWPQITPTLNLDLIKTDIDKGPWAMAMTPMQFCKRHRLLVEMRQQRREGMMRKDWERVDVSLLRGEANKIFALQLGPMWSGVKNLSPHMKALFAVFAARIHADSKAAAKILNQLSLSSSTKLNFTGVDELLKKYLDTKPIQQIITSHAYTFTVMASMLEGARADGVQASADFLWLKPLDRKLWYTLNTVGRQTPFVEVAGVFSHWIAEKEAGHKLLVPMVEEATKALDLALKEVVYRPEE